MNRDSHGLKVAQLAGLPQPAIAVAQTALSWLKAKRAGKPLTDDLRTLGRTIATNASNV